MAQTTEIFPNLRKIYRLIPQSAFLKKSANFLLNNLSNSLSHMTKFNFPPKYPWDWKIEMIAGKYEKNTVDAFKTMIKPGMVVVDIGAHIGFFTRLFSSLVGKNGKVYAFEADKDNFDLLKKNTSFLGNVTILNRAVSDRSGSCTLYKVKNNTGCHSIFAQDFSHKVEVRAVTIDDFFEQQKNIVVDVVKIDIEGAEALAISGMKRTIKNSPKLKVIMEFNPEALGKTGVNPVSFLENLSHDFNIFQVQDKGTLRIFSTGDIEKISYYYGKNKYTNLLLSKR